MMATYTQVTRRGFTYAVSSTAPLTITSLDEHGNWQTLLTHEGGAGQKHFTALAEEITIESSGMPSITPAFNLPEIPCYEKEEDQDDAGSGGDGLNEGAINALINDLAAVSKALTEHVDNDVLHVSATDREAWDAGGALPEWTQAIEGDASGISRLVLKPNSVGIVSSYTHSGGEAPLLSYDGYAYLTLGGEGVSSVRTLAGASSGFGEKLPEWTQAIQGDISGIRLLRLTAGFRAMDDSELSVLQLSEGGQLTLGDDRHSKVAIHSQNLITLGSSGQAHLEVLPMGVNLGHMNSCFVNIIAPSSNRTINSETIQTTT